MNVTRSVNKRCIEEGGENIDDVTRNNEGPKRFDIEGTVKGENRKKNVIDELTDKRGKIISEPQKFSAISR